MDGQVVREDGDVCAAADAEMVSALLADPHALFERGLMDYFSARFALCPESLGQFFFLRSGDVFFRSSKPRHALPFQYVHSIYGIAV